MRSLLRSPWVRAMPDAGKASTAANAEASSSRVRMVRWLMLVETRAGGARHGRRGQSPPAPSFTELDEPESPDPDSPEPDESDGGGATVTVGGSASSPSTAGCVAVAELLP